MQSKHFAVLPIIAAVAAVAGVTLVARSALTDCAHDTVYTGIRLEVLEVLLWRVCIQFEPAETLLTVSSAGMAIYMAVYTTRSTHAL
jgi:hypothetical protein